MPNVKILQRIADTYPQCTHVIPNVGTFVGPVPTSGHDVTRRHHGLRNGKDAAYHWCISHCPGGFGINQRVWNNARVAEVVAGWRTPRSKTALVRVAPT